MKICIAQTKPVTGDVAANINRHLQFINMAVEAGAEMIIFPELSITGYEPTMATALATTPADDRFEPFQQASNQHQITIGIGVPLKKNKGINIGMLLFQPGSDRVVYAKHYLHADEEPFFTSGENTIGLLGNEATIALAICYELSVPAHAAKAVQQGAGIYLTSVAKTAQGVAKAAERLAQLARDHSLYTLMANCLGLNDGVVCGGRSAIWNKKGELLAELDDQHEGLLLLNTDTEDVVAKQL